MKKRPIVRKEVLEEPVTLGSSEIRARVRKSMKDKTPIPIDYLPFIDIKEYLKKT
jgi:hypothetical protein